ncbi:alpha-amylase, partial [Vibrio breoganii]
LKVPSDVVQNLKIADGNYLLDEHIEGVQQQVLSVEKNVNSFNIELQPLASLVWVLYLNE